MKKERIIFTNLEFIPLKAIILHSTHCRYQLIMLRSCILRLYWWQGWVSVTQFINLIKFWIYCSNSSKFFLILTKSKPCLSCPLFLQSTGQTTFCLYIRSFIYHSFFKMASYLLCYAHETYTSRNGSKMRMRACGLKTFLPWSFACRAKPWSWGLLFLTVISNFR